MRHEECLGAERGANASIDAPPESEATTGSTGGSTCNYSCRDTPVPATTVDAATPVTECSLATPHRHAPIARFLAQTNFLVRCPCSPPGPCPSRQHSPQYRSPSHPRHCSVASLLH